MSDTTAGGTVRSALDLYARATAALGRIPDWPLALLARFSAGGVFWISGRNKVTGCGKFDLNLLPGPSEKDQWLSPDISFDFSTCQIKSSTFFQFEDLYQVPLLPSDLAARLATFGEHLFPLLLFLGLATRFGALGLLGMTFVIQTFVFPHAWTTHGMWAVALLFILFKGPGKISLDHLIKQTMRTS